MRNEISIFNRILWDPELQSSSWTVGWLDRFDGVLECPVSDFNLDGEIPFHRIRYFKRDGVIVWDRVRRIDRLTSPTAYAGR